MEYQAPELQYVGEASQVVLGFGNFGGDVYSEVQSLQQEFEQD